MKFLNYLKNVPKLSWFIKSLIFIFLILVLTNETDITVTKQQSFDWIKYLIVNFQTLIAGIIAFIGAWLTVQTMRKQEKDRIYRASMTLRSRLPDAISDLLTYCKLCVEYLYLENRDLPDCINYNDSIQVLRNNIEYSDTNTAQSLFEIISFYQVHNARFCKYIDVNPRIIQNNDLMALDTIKLANYLHQLFSYARNEEEKFALNKKPSEEDIYHSFRQLIGLLNYDDPEFDTLNRLFNRN